MLAGRPVRGRVLQPGRLANRDRVLGRGRTSWTSVWDAASGAKLSQTVVSCGRISAVSFSPDGRSPRRPRAGTGRRADPRRHLRRRGRPLAVRGDPDRLPQPGRLPDRDHVPGRAREDLGRQLAKNRSPSSRAPGGHGGGVQPGRQADRDGVRRPDGAHLGRRDPQADRRPGRGTAGSVRSVSFNRDGTRLVTASADQTARIWDTATGEPLRALEGSRRGGRRSRLQPGRQTGRHGLRGRRAGCGTR